MNIQDSFSHCSSHCHQGNPILLYNKKFNIEKFADTCSSNCKISQVLDKGSLMIIINPITNEEQYSTVSEESLKFMVLLILRLLKLILESYLYCEIHAVCFLDLWEILDTFLFLLSLDI